MFRLRFRKLRTFLVLLTVGTLGFGTVATVTAGTASAAAKAATGKPIKVAFFTELSGPYSATFKTTILGAQAYVKSVNANGGINGRPIQIVTYDTGSDPTQAVNEARLAVADKPFAIVAASAYLDSAMPYLAAQPLPIVGWGISRNWYTAGTADNVFSWTGKVVGKTTTSWATRLLDAGDKKIAMVGDTSSGPDVVLNQWSQMVKDLGGQITFTERALNANDAAAVTAVAQKIIDSGAQAVMSTTGTGNVALQAALVQLGSHVTVQSGGEYSPAIPKQFGSAANGYTVATFFAPFQSKGVKGLNDYLKVMSKYAPSVKEDVFAADGYISMQFFVQGFRIAGGNPTQAQYIKAMQSMTNYTMNGLVPAISFPAFHYDPATCLGFVKLQDGKWIPTGKSKPFVCGKVYPFQK